MAQKTDGTVKEQYKLKKPEMFKILLHNDDYTTMEFVVKILQTVFHKSTSEATKIMLDVHKKGQGLVGMYTYDIAHTKVVQVLQMAENEEFPLRCTMEKA